MKTPALPAPRTTRKSWRKTAPAQSSPYWRRWWWAPCAAPTGPRCSPWWAARAECRLFGSSRSATGATRRTPCRTAKPKFMKPGSAFRRHLWFRPRIRVSVSFGYVVPCDLTILARVPDQRKQNIFYTYFYNCCFWSHNRPKLIGKFILFILFLFIFIFFLLCLFIQVYIMNKNDLPRNHYKHSYLLSYHCTMTTWILISSM